jgi:glycosyltransferase involved in cell wall biosynthesis
MKTRATSIPILYLHESHQFGGGETSLLNLMRSLNRERFVPRFVCQTESKFIEELRKLSVPVDCIRFPSWRIPNPVAMGRIVNRLNGIIKSHKAALLHANTPRTNLYAALLGKLNPGLVRVVWHARSEIENEKVDVDNLFSFLPGRILCNSDAIRRRFQKNGRQNPRAITIINGVDTQTFNPSISGAAIREEFGIDAGTPLVGIVGRIDPNKGHDVLIEATAQILPTVSFRLMIVGTPPPEAAGWANQLRYDLLKYRIDSHVIFTGFREDVPQILAALDLLVLASEKEGCSRTVIEAMAMGKPVLGTNTGGTPELVVDGVTGVLIPPKQPEALAGALAKMLTDREKMRRMGAAGLRRVLEHLTIEAHIRKTEAVYETLVAAKSCVNVQHG